MNLNKKSDPSFDDLMLSTTANYLRLSKSIIVLKSFFFVPFFSFESTCDCKDHACNVKIENGLVYSCKLENCVIYSTLRIMVVFISLVV